MTWTAYVDESVRMDVYLLAAACLDVSEAVDARATITQLSRPGVRSHWRDADDDARQMAVSVVAGLPLLHIVVTASPLDLRRQERARRHCMRRLLFELDNASVGHVQLESRGQRQDMRDLQLVNVLRIQHVIGPMLVVDHAQPLAEPLLWIPDIVAGAVGAELGQNKRLTDQLAAVLAHHHEDLR